MTDHRIDDQSNDHKYFSVTPRLVWALCEDPYEFTLWSVIRDISGEKGGCILGIEALAILGMMSVNKAKQCRKKLLKKGLLEGSLQPVPGSKNVVWHLSVPDLWGKNTSWSERYNSLASRLDFKRGQFQESKGGHQETGSSGDGGHQERESPGDERESPGDERESPGGLKEESLKDSLRRTGGEIWQKVVAALQATYFPTPRDKRNFERYILPLEWIDRENGVVRVRTGSPEHRDWLEARRTIFERTFNGFTELAGADIEFVVLEM
jgi:hypothetical protein